MSANKKPNLKPNSTHLKEQPAQRRQLITSNPTQSHYFKDIVETIREPLLVLDKDMHVLSANRSFYKLFKVKQKETVGSLVYDLGNRQWDIPALRLMLETVLPQKAIFNDYELEHEFPSIGRRILLLNARRIPTPTNDAQQILLAFEDITDRRHLERTLQTSEERFRRAFETAQDCMLLVDKTSGMVVNSNQAAQDSLNYSNRALLKKNIWDLHIVDDHKQFEKVFKELEEKGFVEILGKTIKNRHGGHFSADINLMDRAAVIQCNIRDITKRKHVEDALRESEEKFRTLADQSPNMIFINKKGRVVYANTKCEEILGYNRDEFYAPDFSFLNLIALDSKELVQNLYKEHLERNEFPPYEYGLITKTGRRIEAINASKLIHYEDGEAILGIVTDITERKMAEEALQQSETALKQAQRVAQVGSWAWHIQSNRLEWSDEMYHIFGIEKEKFSGDLTEVIKRSIHPEDRSAVEASNLLVAKDHKSVPLEYRVIWPDGTIRVVWGEAGDLTLDAKGNPEILMGIVQDITERKKTEEALRESQKLLLDITDNSSSLIYALDLQGRFLSINKCLENVLGAARETLLGKTRDAILPAEIAAEHRNNDLKVMNDRRSYTFDEENIDADGKHNFISTKFPLVDSQGLLYGIGGVSTDITERKLVEDALAQAEAKYRNLFENAIEGIFQSTPAGKFITANPALARLLGYDLPEEMIASANSLPNLYVQPGRREEYKHQIERDGKIAGFESEVYRKDGSTLWISENGFTVRDDQGKVIHYDGTLTDITERKQAEEKLLESEERFRSLYENATIGMYRTTPGGQIVMANPALVRMLGYESLDELTRRDLTKEGYEPEYPRQDFQQLMEQKGEVHGLEAAWKRKDGSSIYVRESARLVRDDMNRLLYYEGTVEDVTERRQAEEALRESESSLQAVLQSTADGILAVNAENEVLYANDRFAEQWRIPEEVLASKDDFLLLQYVLDQLSDPQGFLKKVQELYESRDESFDLLDFKDGRVFERLSCPLYLGAESIGRVWSFRDITERRQAEKEILKLNSELEQRVEERTHALREAQEQLVRKEKLATLGQLAGGVGHELRNPLSVINTSVYYLKLAQLAASGKIKEHLGMIEMEVHNADKIITDLLDFARGITAEREHSSVPELVQHVLERFPAPPSVKVRLEIPADLPMVFADPRQVDQVLGNLVLNAYQSMVSHTGTLSLNSTLSVKERGKVTFSARMEKEMVAIAVKDVGMGISTENVRKLFEPLFTTKAKGIGLGLAVSKKLAEANGGWIEVESEVGKGSTFTLWLPVEEK